MKLYYAAIFRDTTPLVVYSPEPGNYEKIFIEKMADTLKVVGKNFLKVDNCLWVISHDDHGLNILMVVQNTSEREIVEQFCDEIKSRFLRAHGAEWRSAQAHELYTRFEPTFRLVKQMIEASSSEKSREVFPPTPVETGLTDFPTAFGNEVYRARQGTKCHKSCKAVLFILLILTCVYIALVLFCGGYDLKPECISE